MISGMATTPISTPMPEPTESQTNISFEIQPSILDLTTPMYADRPCAKVIALK